VKQIKRLESTDKVYLGLLLAVFGGIVLHAPISVAFSVLLPDYSLLIKSWKEILMLAAALIGLYVLYKRKQLSLLKSPLILMLFAYTALHFILIPYKNNGLNSTLAGLMIDLRFLFYFGLMYVAMKLYPDYRKTFIKVGLIGALAVLVFALLQVTILPNDILKYLGYSKDTIAPFLTIDQNNAFIRINSTLRGPNPLGAYAGTVLILMVAYLVKRKLSKEKKEQVIAALLVVGGIAALWFSYSRSAWLGTLVGIITVLAIANIKKVSISRWVNIGVGLVILLAGLVMLLNTPFVSNVILHENPTEGNNINSNEGHLQSLTNSSKEVLKQPLGTGVGGTGSASLLGSKSQIVENQYLFVAHESGWLGLVLFMTIFITVMIGLWNLRSEWFSLGVFAAGLNLAIIGLFLPVFADDTISIIWWGLAAIALYSQAQEKVYR